MSPVPGSGEEVEATIHQENEKDVDEAVLPNEEAHMRKLGSMASPMKRKLSSGLREAWSAVTDSAEIQPEIKRPRVLAPDRRTPPNSVTRHEASFGQLPSPQGSAPQTSDQVPSSINGNNLVTREWSKLPRDVWRRIYTLLSPVELINLLGVNRSFYNDLAPSTFGISGPSNRAPKFSHQGREADEIWVSSRKRFFPGTPNRPLRGRSELDMWRIINSRFCQSCGKEGHREMIASMGFPWEPNLGEDGVTIIWPFGVRRCGSCLLEETEKELTLLISSSVPSTLLAALPFIFVTPSLHVITPTMLQKATPRPTLQMTKVFFKADIQVIMHQFDDVRAESPAATEAWINGLEKQAKENSDNAGQWERWFTTGVVNRSITLPGRTASDATSALVSASQVAADHSGPGSASNNSSPASYITSSFGGVKVESPSQSYSPRDLVHGLPRHVASGAPPRSSMSPGQSAFFHPPNQSFQRGRTERSNREINEFKAARRAEIERRCSELDPPIQPTLLSHMESFQAAMKILTPLTDSAWDVLRPRLIAQREAAEYAENERMAQSRAFQAKFEERRQQEASLKEHKDMLDKEWDEMQSPIRELLAKYADEIIDGSWKSGEAITNDTSPKFAADVLIHVRKRFYHDVAEEDAADSTAGREVKRDTQGSPPTRRLILENMKWVFDTKIKPLTEPFRKELFLCNGCENNFKFYGFEGVIQHFAAKHTSELSMGSVIVHWRAEWPEDPPFHPNPSAAKAAFYAVPPPAGMPGHPGSGVSQTSFPYSGYSQGSGPMAHLPPRGAPGYPQYSPVPFGHQQYGEHYPNNVHGPFPPPQAYSGPSHGFHQGNTGYSSTHPGYSGHPSGFPGQYPPYPAPHSGYNGPSPNFQGYSSYQGQPPQSFSSPMQSHVYPSVVQGPVQSGPGGYGQTPASLGQHGPIGPPYGQGLAYQGPASGHNKAPPANMYKLQLDEIATLARDVWLNTSGIKDLPGSVRTTVIIQHVVSRFVAKFPNEPALSLFADGLADHAAMKPIRSINGLTCKACGISQQPRHHSIEKRFYSLSGILLHFQKEHIEQTITIHPNHPLSPRLDWKVDMVELPPEHVIGDLLRAPGMDDTKLQALSLSCMMRSNPVILLYLALVVHHQNVTGSHPAGFPEMDRTMLMSTDLVLQVQPALLHIGAFLTSAPPKATLGSLEQVEMSVWGQRQMIPTQRNEHVPTSGVMILSRRSIPDMMITVAVL
ncbi:MAG: hypothetical protein M1833_000414 [Piccolia ochrophora]|nr:MAG: hypothetical protein M1833_000414 [Piccolia ochrophora]